jgi:hypothetical protein
MATKPTQSSSGKGAKHASKFMGRSAVTGQFVLRPASKAGTISLKEASSAVKSISRKKK